MVPSGFHTNKCVALFVSLKSPAISPAELIGPARVASAFGTLIVVRVPSGALKIRSGGGSVRILIRAGDDSLPVDPCGDGRVRSTVRPVRLMNVPSGCLRKPT